MTLRSLATDPSSATDPQLVTDPSSSTSQSSIADEPGQERDLGADALPKPELGDETLAPEWLDWCVENYVEGVEPPELLSALRQAGVPHAIARDTLRFIRNNSLIRSFRRKVAARDQLHQLVHLKGDLARRAPLDHVERRGGVSAAEFFEIYYAANRPVILTDVAHGWPALERWSRPSYFAEKFGETPLTVCMGRESDPHCDRNFARHLRQTTMSEYAAWVATAGETNDGYLISNNRLLESEAFHSLLEDIVPPEQYVDPARFYSHMSFWFGPAGTKTPLHHDGNNILFCQVVGRKEFFLVSPWEIDLMVRAEGFYAHTQVPEDKEDEGYRAPDGRFPWAARRVVLGPGEALFLPVGWWHQVRALDVSVSISFLNFRAENQYKWYAPGKLNRP